MLEMSAGTDMESFQDTVTERRGHANYFPKQPYGAYGQVCKTTLPEIQVSRVVIEGNRCEHFEEPNLLMERRSSTFDVGSS